MIEVIMKNNSEVIEKPFRIYAEFGDNNTLKKALNKIAKQLHIEVYFGSDWDFIATNFKIAVIDRRILDPEAWKFYIGSEMVDELSNEIVILVDNQPIKQIPQFYNIDNIDSSTKEGIENIIGLVRNTQKLSSKHHLV